MRTRKPVLLLLAALILSLACPLDLSAQNQRIGKHTVAEWRAIIDSTWGPGLPTATKLEIFDSFWNRVDQGYSGFPYLDVNWDSLKAVYRPQVEAGVSRGRFSAIMDRLWFSLEDLHASTQDVGVTGYSSLPGAPRGVGPGTPMFWHAGTSACGVFGAALTPQPDSSLLVYRVIKDHPLGLAAGDVVLGYDRIPWKRLYKEILAAEFPLGWTGMWGTTPRSRMYALLSAAGINWGLFDTVDVVKYATGDTLHLPTAPLKGLPWEALWASDQLPVPGVRMPNHVGGEFLTYGVVEGTSIGYVYCARWYQSEASPFRAALSDLLQVKKVTGLILDCRFNAGGDVDHAPDVGFDLLFSENPTGASRWRHAMRIRGDDHFAFSRSAPFDASFVVNPDYYDRPIAVLTGPAAASMGDMHSFRLRFHPMARLFGLPTNGAFSVPDKYDNNVFTGQGPLWGSWFYQIPLGQMESLVNNEGFLMHKGFPVDEEVWLTREGAARGEDDVVKRAIQWITTVTHAHHADLAQHYGRPGLDSMTVTAVLANPQGHQTRLSAIMTGGSGMLLDSVLLFNDGRHGDGAAGDSLWGGRFLAPAVEGDFEVSLQTDDLTLGTSRRLPKATLLTTAGPLALDSLAVLNHPEAAFVSVRPRLKNLGQSAAVVGATVALSCSDSGVTGVVPATLTVNPLPPGASLLTNGAFTVQYDPARATGRRFQLHCDLGLNGQTCWDTTFTLTVTALAEEQHALPRTYRLEQNYPNPFNPSTMIRYALPRRSHVTLTVFNMLGQEVAELVKGEVEAGYHHIQFDAGTLASGVYFYRLQAGSFTETKRLVVVK